MAVLGIDPSYRKLAFVVLSGTGSYLRHEEVAKLGKSMPETCARAASETRSLVIRLAEEGIEVTHAWIESPVVGRGGAQVTIKQAVVNGAVQGALYDCGVAVETVQNTSWKRVVCGHGGMGKPDVTLWLHRHRVDLARILDSQDLVDAACIALHGVEALSSLQGPG